MTHRLDLTVEPGHPSMLGVAGPEANVYFVSS